MKFNTGAANAERKYRVKSFQEDYTGLLKQIFGPLENGYKWNSLNEIAFTVAFRAVSIGPQPLKVKY